MKNCRYYSLPLVLGATLLFACEKYVDFNGKELLPKMVISAIINAKSDTGTIKISESVFDYSSQKSVAVENPEINLKINGESCAQLWFDTLIGVHSYYKFISHLKTGDRVEFSAHTSKHGTVKGYDIVPEIVAEIKNIEPLWFKRDGFGYLRLLVTVRDNPDEKNFYRIVVRTNAVLINPSIQEVDNRWDLKEVFVDDEILFNTATEKNGEGKTPDYYRIFSDEMFQGKEYTLNIYIRNDNFTENVNFDYVRQSVKVEIHTLSEKLYQNLHSQELASGITGDVFSEPVKIYTNMQGGYGILGIYNVAEKIKPVAEKGN
ncbi:MAG: DUF4249 domain-containing protein [Prevotellaceae bacterium]|jgi:hypothetical protein|nr:DUF4249 domain-containing protein [Prevotellaceae bacterium]